MKNAMPTMKDVAQEAGVALGTVSKVFNGIPVGESYRIKVEEAARMLQGPFTLTAEVVHGKRLARTLSWPTINQLFPLDFTVPRYGVYWSRVLVGGREWDGVTNVGIKPTLHETNLTMETYILDYDGDLYGERIPVSLLRFLRPEQRFPSVQELSQRIIKDIGTVRELSKTLPRVSES